MKQFDTTKHLITLKVNGEPYEVAVNPNRTLLDCLREDLCLTGTKKGCDTGNCGACTVILDGKAINSCLMLAIDARDKDILTIEGLAGKDGLHPLQEAFIEHSALQCGYCTPGVIMAAKYLLDHNANPTEREVKQGIAGNLCRCGAYVEVLEAILAAATERPQLRA